MRKFLLGAHTDSNKWKVYIRKVCCLAPEATFFSLSHLRSHVEEKHMCRQKQYRQRQDRCSSSGLTGVSKSSVTGPGRQAWAQLLENGCTITYQDFLLNHLMCNGLIWFHPTLDTHLWYFILLRAKINVHSWCSGPLQTLLCHADFGIPGQHMAQGSMWKEILHTAKQNRIYWWKFWRSKGSKDIWSLFNYWSSVKNVQKTQWSRMYWELVYVKW